MYDPEHLACTCSVCYEIHSCTLDDLPIKIYCNVEIWGLNQTSDGKVVNRGFIDGLFGWLFYRYHDSCRFMTVMSPRRFVCAQVGIFATKKLIVEFREIQNFFKLNNKIFSSSQSFGIFRIKSEISQYTEWNSCVSDEIIIRDKQFITSNKE